MAKRNTTTIKEPEWFKRNIGQYQNISSTDYRIWMAQVYVRFCYLLNFEQLKIEELTDSERACGYSKFKVVKAIQAQGVVEHRIAKKSSPKFKGAAEMHLTSDITKALQSKYPFDTSIKNEDYDEVDYGVFSKCLDWSDNHVCISLDLRHTDKVLLDSVSRIILEKRMRSEEDFILSSRKPPLQNWIDSGVLPYLDLHFWARENNLNLTDAELSRIMALNGYDIGSMDDVRKTTRKQYANNFLTNENFRLLKFYA